MCIKTPIPVIKTMSINLFFSSATLQSQHQLHHTCRAGGALLPPAFSCSWSWEFMLRRMCVLRAFHMHFLKCTFSLCLLMIRFQRVCVMWGCDVETWSLWCTYTGNGHKGLVHPKKRADGKLGEASQYTRHFTQRQWAVTDGTLTGYVPERSPSNTWMQAYKKIT